MKITSAERNRKNKNRLSIYVDGKFSFTISEDDYVSMNLYENPVLTEEKIDYIKNTLNFREAKALAVRYLSLRLRTEQEIRVRLKDEGYDSACIEQVIEELESIGYINNKLYAQKYVFDRSKLKPLSKRLMRQELRSKGIPDDVADEVLEDWKIEDNAVAENLLKRKFGKYDMSNEKIRQKAYMFLLHRGFSHDTIAEALHSFNIE